MADELNLKVFADRVSATLLPHLRENNQSSNSFKQAAISNSNDMKRIAKDLYTAIASQRKDISSLASAIQSNNNYTINHATKTAETNDLLRQNLQFQNMIIRQLNMLNTTSRSSVQTQSLAFAGVKQGLTTLGKYYDYGITRLSRSLFGRLGNNATYQALGRIAGGGLLAGGAVAGGAALGALGGAIRKGVESGPEGIDTSDAKIRQGLDQERNAPPSGPTPSGPSSNIPQSVDDRTKYGEKDISKPSGSEIAKTSHPYNVERRKKLYDEIKNTPGLKEWVAGVISKEGDPTAVLESIVNRSLMNNKSIANSTNFNYSGNVSNSFFGPIRRGQVKSIKINPHMERAFKEVFEQGSDILGYRTDQGMRGEHKPAEKAGLAHTIKKIRGDYYSEMGKSGAKFRSEEEKRKQEWEKSNPNWRNQQSNTSSTNAIPNPQDQQNGPKPDASKFDSKRGNYQTERVRKSAENLSDPVKEALSKFQEMNPQDQISSTYRSPMHPIERAKQRPGQHAHGNAIDVSTRGKSKEEIENTIQGLKKSGFNFILLEGNPPHIHAEVRPGKDFDIKNLGRGHPSISLDDARKAASKVDKQEPPRRDPEKQQPNPPPQPNTPQPNPQPNTPIPTSYKPTTGDQLNQQAVKETARQKAATEQILEDKTTEQPESSGAMNVDYRTQNGPEDNSILSNIYTETGKFKPFNPNYWNEGRKEYYT
jgi:uncharacterized protein YcbK (DUF882 family)